MEVVILLETSIITSALLLVFSFVNLIIFFIKKIKKKKTYTGKISLFSFLAVVLLLFIALFIEDIPSGFIISGLLLLIIAVFSLIIGIILKLLKKKKAKAFITSTVAVVFSIVCFFATSISWNTTISDPKNYEVKIQRDFDFEVKDGAEPIQVLKSKGFNDKYSSYQLVYDADDYKLLFRKDFASTDECLDALNNNKNISKKYKEFFSDFIKRIGNKYPDANLSVLYRNLKTLKVVELNQRDYYLKSLSVDSLGCYLKNENAIYIPKGTKYTEGEFGFQVIIHEFCHAARTSWWQGKNGKSNRIDFQSDNDNILLMEAMNSAFSCSLLNYYEHDIAYQIPSNYLRIMLECMDNYSLSDYMNHSDTYFLSKLDEYTGYTNYAKVIWDLITVQRSDYEKDNIDINPDEYYPIYSFLCDMYYKKYIKSEMTDGEKKKVADELVEKAFYDTPEGYKTDKEYFYEYLKTNY